MNKKEEFIGIVEKVDFPNKATVDVNGEKVIIKNLIPGQKIRGCVTKRRKNKYLGRLFKACLMKNS
jgi:tRNA/tmRNA/rRNA uracil-C5-methylase (TrmA/RlmC/RlmD family)